MAQKETVVRGEADRPGALNTIDLGVSESGQPARSGLPVGPADPGPGKLSRLIPRPGMLGPLPEPRQEALVEVGWDGIRHRQNPLDRQRQARTVFHTGDGQLRAARGPASLSSSAIGTAREVGRRAVSRSTT